MLSRAEQIQMEQLLLTSKPGEPHEHPPEVTSIVDRIWKREIREVSELPGNFRETN